MINVVKQKKLATITKLKKSLAAKISAIVPYDQTDEYKTREYEVNKGILSDSWWGRWKKQYGNHKPTDVVARDIVSRDGKVLVRAINSLEKHGIEVSQCGNFKTDFQSLSFNDKGKIYIDDFVDQKKMLINELDQCVVNLRKTLK